MKKVAGLIAVLFIFMVANAFADENNGIKYMDSDEFKKFSEDFKFYTLYNKDDPYEDETEELLGARPYLTSEGVYRDEKGVITETSYFMLVLPEENNKSVYKIIVVPNIVGMSEPIRGESGFVERAVYYLHDGQLKLYQLDDSRKILGYFKQSMTMLKDFGSRAAK